MVQVSGARSSHFDNSIPRRPLISGAADAAGARNVHPGDLFNVRCQGYRVLQLLRSANPFQCKLILDRGMAKSVVGVLHKATVLGVLGLGQQPERGRGLPWKFFPSPGEKSYPMSPEAPPAA